MLLSYACSFPHNNIHTYIMYIFRVSISMCKCLYDSIPLYSIHVKVYFYCLTLNCYCPLSNCYCLTLSCYCPISNCYYLTLSCYCLTFPTVTVWLWTVTVWLFQPLLFDFSNRYCLTLNCYCLTFPTVTVWLFQPLPSDFSNCYCLTFPTVTVWLFQPLLSDFELLLSTLWTVTV
jgi:hypothetical protein